MDLDFKRMILWLVNELYKDKVDRRDDTAKLLLDKLKEQIELEMKIQEDPVKAFADALFGTQSTDKENK